MSEHDITANVTPCVLTWARHSCGWTRRRVANMTRFTETELREWERGERQPSLRDARVLAAVYGRPLAFFHLPGPPRPLLVEIIERVRYRLSQARRRTR